MSEKNCDHRGRWRNCVIAFRVSPEEREAIRRMMKLSGLNQQEYIMHRLLEKPITVVGNPRVHRALKQQMELLSQELRRVRAGEEIDPDLQEAVEAVTGVYEGLGAGPREQVTWP